MTQEPWWQTGWTALCGKCANTGYASLSDPEKIWLNIRALIDATESGGLISYFYNSGADTLVDAMTALDMLDARDVRLQVERVAHLFAGGVPVTVEARNEVINSWPEGDDARDLLLSEVDRTLMPMLTILERKLESFVREHWDSA